MISNTVFLIAHGDVQNVMFRQTIIRAAQKLGIEAGATNNSDKTSCSITLKGPIDKTNSLINVLKSRKVLNSWGAQVFSVDIKPKGISIEEHTVNTKNVDDFHWRDDVDFYI